MISTTYLLLRGIAEALDDAAEPLPAHVNRYRLSIAAAWIRSVAHLVKNEQWQGASETLLLQLEELEKLDSAFFTNMVCNHLRSIALVLGRDQEMVERYARALYMELIENLPVVVGAWLGVEA